jgi:predicted transcriptional regulator
MPYASKRQERDARGVAALFLEVPVEMRSAVKTLAKEQDRTMGWVIRRAIAAELARHDSHLRVSGSL